jgi:hypothetical protein
MLIQAIRNASLCGMIQYVSLSLRITYAVAVAVSTSAPSAVARISAGVNSAVVIGPFGHALPSASCTRMIWFLGPGTHPAYCQSLSTTSPPESTRHTVHHNNPILLVNVQHLQVLDRNTLVAHVSRHALSRQHTRTGTLGTSSGTHTTMHERLTVGRGLTAEAVTFHALKHRQFSITSMLLSAS